MEAKCKHDKWFGYRTLKQIKSHGYRKCSGFRCEAKRFTPEWYEEQAQGCIKCFNLIGKATGEKGGIINNHELLDKANKAYYTYWSKNKVRAKEFLKQINELKANLDNIR